MLDEVKELTNDARRAREAMIGQLKEFSAEQAAFKPTPESWSAVDVVEHLVLAERGGIHMMWVALEAWREGDPVWKEPHPDRDKPIEEIIAATWQPKEQAPQVATPKLGGPLPYWLAEFTACQGVLEALAKEMREGELDDVIYPHFLSGPLTLRQRFEFIRFHIQRHRDQIDELAANGPFPAA